MEYELEENSDPIEDEKEKVVTNRDMINKVCWQLRKISEELPRQGVKVSVSISNV